MRRLLTALRTSLALVRIRGRRGRLLAVRFGFNPNSSSVGTGVIVFLWALLVSQLLLNLIAGFVLPRTFRRACQREEEKK